MVKVHLNCLLHHYSLIKQVRDHVLVDSCIFSHLNHVAPHPLQIGRNVLVYHKNLLLTLPDLVKHLILLKLDR